MNRTPLFVGASCLVLLLPALADAQSADRGSAGADLGTRLTSRPLAAPVHAAVPAVPSAPESCRGDAAAPVTTNDSRWMWRLRALHHLDCVTALVDAALHANAGGEGGEAAEVRLPRADLERIRQLTWWARDAAARIGQ